ncbi:MAG: glycosyltransferase family 2 protein [Solobacterium sp.]|nr:glycosyltransferase family 2 protein [Solobacterium sp.]
MRKPEISVIVPVYHVEKYLAKCLDSILNQTFTDIEILLVNDGGNETETAICRAYAAKDSRIRLFEQENQGLSAARNTALKEVRGEWIMFVDSDDWVADTFCETALKAVTEDQSQMCIFDLCYTYGDSAEGKVHASKLTAGCYDSYTVLKERLQGNIAGYVWNKIYHRSLWEDIIFPVGEKWEDDAVLHEVIDRAKIISIIHDVLYYKPSRDDNITSVAFRNMEQDKWIYIQRMKRYNYLKEHHPELLEVTRDNFSAVTARYCTYCLEVLKDKNEYSKARQWLIRENIRPVFHGTVFSLANVTVNMLLRMGLPFFRIVSKAMLYQRKRQVNG